MGTRLDIRIGSLLLIAACGGGPEGPAGPTTTRSLLAVPPSEVYSCPGALLPLEESGWEAGRGWVAQTNHTPDGVAFVRSTTSVAQLALRASAPAARRLELHAGFFEERVDGPTRRELHLTLNGVPMGALQLGRELATDSIETPAEAWLPGVNQLELALDSTGAAPGDRPLLGVSRLAWGETAAVVHDADARKLSLDHGAGALWTLEQSGPVRLSFVGTADAEGVLELHVSQLDPETGARLGDLPPLRLPVRGGELEAELVLPPPPLRMVRRLELFWHASSGGASRLNLERLDLEEEGSSSRPPVIFISIDTLAARHMSLHGYPRDTTPHIDDFARESVTFDECLANAPWTGPSYFSQVTGVYGDAFRMDVAEDAPLEQRMNAWFLTRHRWTLAESLASAGYRTAAFVDSPWLVETQGFAQGFEHFDSTANDIHPTDTTGGLEHILPRAYSWLDSIDTSEPFFLFLQGIDVHGPYTPDEAHQGALPPDSSMDLDHRAPVSKQAYTFGSVPAYIARGLYPTDALPQFLQTAEFTAAYDEEILAMDAQVGALLAELKRRGIFERAVVVLSSDHGESMIDHEWMFGHGLLYQDTLHVPLIVHLPGDQRGGTRVDQMVELLDLYPTLTQLARAAPSRDYVQGRSLVPLLSGGTRVERPVLSEGKILSARSVTHEGWKLIESFPDRSELVTLTTHPHVSSLLFKRFPELAPRKELGLRPSDFARLEQEYPGLEAELRRHFAGPLYELYDLNSDPREQNNQAAERTEKREQMIALLREREAASARARERTVPDGLRVNLSAEAISVLSDLGYTDAQDD